MRKTLMLITTATFTLALAGAANAQVLGGSGGLGGGLGGTLSLADGDTNLVLTVIPEPGSAALALLALHP